MSRLADLLPYNHLGPFEMREVIKIPNAALGGSQSVTVALDMRGLLTGTVVAYNMHGDLRTQSWVTISTKGKYVQTVYSWDGFYEAYLPQGAYTVTAQESGMTPQAVTVTIPDGGVTNLSFYLRPSGIPIPEYSSSTLLLTMGTIVCITLLLITVRKRKK